MVVVHLFVCYVLRGKNSFLCNNLAGRLMDLFGDSSC